MIFSRTNLINVSLCFIDSAKNMRFTFNFNFLIESHKVFCDSVLTNDNTNSISTMDQNNDDKAEEEYNNKFDDDVDSISSSSFDSYFSLTSKPEFHNELTEIGKDTC